MSFIKQKPVYVLDGDSATPTLTSQNMGEVIFSASSDKDLYLGYPEDGLWYRILNTTNYNLNIISATPTAPDISTIVNLTSHEDKLLISNNNNWYAFSSNYWMTGVFGNVTENNYAEFENTGFLQFNGSAGSYNDVPPNPIIKSKVGGSGVPTLTTFVGNIEQYTFAVNDYVYDNFEFLHEYEEGTDFEMHLHWATNGVDTTDRYVKFEYEYTVSNSAATPTFYQFPSSTVISAEIMIPANTPDKTHIKSTIGLEDGTGLKIGAILAYRLKRISASGTAPSNNPFVLQAGCHIKQDTGGSRTRYTKT